MMLTMMVLGLKYGDKLMDTYTHLCQGQVTVLQPFTSGILILNFIQRVFR